MHDPNPHKVTNAEWRELGNLTVIRESWGLQRCAGPSRFGYTRVWREV